MVWTTVWGELSQSRQDAKEEEGRKKERSKEERVTKKGRGSGRSGLGCDMHSTIAFACGKYCRSFSRKAFSLRLGGFARVPRRALSGSAIICTACCWLLPNIAAAGFPDADNGINGRFKPAIVHTSREDNWQQPPAGGRSRRRWAALETPRAADVYAGAPYLVQLPSGVTVLSVQSAEDRDELSTHRYARMAVYVGDSTARNFTNRSFPFGVPSGASGLWNSLFVKDEATITAISGTTIDGTRGLWAIDGRITTRPTGL